MSDKERFVELCSGINRNGINGLLAWLETTDFYRAPASTRYHLSCEGGLLKHSLHVYDEAKRLLSVYPEIEVSEDSVRIATLFHDICKVDFYGVEKRNRKNEFGRWESYDAYTVQERLKFGAHGAKSVILVQRFIRLTDEEAVAILHHMSAFDAEAKNVGAAFEAYPFAWLVSVADQSATYITERDG